MNQPNFEKRLTAKKALTCWGLSLPGFLWLFFFFFIPYLIIFLYSFFKPGVYGVEAAFSLRAYQEMLRSQYLYSYLHAFRLALVTTIICLIIGYPVAYFMARSSETVKDLLLMLLIIPFWTNFIIRVFAWRIFLAPEGILNAFISFWPIFNQPLRILRTDLAVTIVMVYVYLPYMCLPLYSVLAKIDFTLLDAARDLGAGKWKSFALITLPLSKGGIVAGIILVFIPSLGAYLIPQIMGNQNSLYLGQIITYRIKNIPQNWPLASSLSFILLILISLLLMAYYHFYPKMAKEGDHGL